MSNLRQITVEEVDRLLTTRELNYFNFYNSDIPVVSHLATQYYLNHSYDTIDLKQIINTLFLDIEAFVEDTTGDSEITAGDHVMNCVTICDSRDKIFRSFYLLREDNVEKFGISMDPNFDFDLFLKTLQIELKQILIEHKYIDDSFNLEIQLFNDELELHKATWRTVHSLDPDALSGWNSGAFDIPYMYNRAVKMFGSKEVVNKMVSKFGHVTEKGGFISIPDFVNADLLYLFKPRDEGGLRN